MTTEGKSHTACKLLTLFINANNEMLSLFWFHIRRIPHHIINFQSLVITFHWSHLTLLCWGTLVLAGCCLCYRLLVLGVPVLAPLAQQWLRLKREERGGGSHLSPYREQETQPDQARHGRSQQKQAHSKYLSESEKVDKHFLGDCQE